MNIIVDFKNDFFSILNEMSPYLLLGFLFAGILHVFFPQKYISRYLGKKNKKSVINATLFGIPLPLCSCGVIPTGISLFKNGASKGSTISFLISTPQTGIDSVMVTYSLLGLPFAIIRPVVAFITGIFGGILINKTEAGSSSIEPESFNNNKLKNNTSKNPILSMLKYAFIDFLQDISKWLIIGLLIATAISVIVPDDFFTSYLGNDYVQMFVVLLASIPLYVCATASVPIAAVLMFKGVSAGAILVFLMAGPATNAATISIITKVLGKKILFYYLFSIITGALIFGFIVNYFFPNDFLFKETLDLYGGHEHHLLPLWVKTASGVTLLLLIAYGYIQKLISRKKQLIKLQNTNHPNPTKMPYITIKIEGMTCNNCKNSVENNLKSIYGIEQVNVNLANSSAAIKGENIDLEKIKSCINSLGYKYKGEVKKS
ncbi:MAG: SO_0444 family Cu/Zn efflux transporter [Bacteroidetes bacterium]|nr:SO_0444 family Cu/Zn efflux transporter [Bacteroidota bacterium]